jgi:Tfp pilus assembly protein PilF
MLVASGTLMATPSQYLLPDKPKSKTTTHKSTSTHSAKHIIAPKDNTEESIVTESRVDFAPLAKHKVTGPIRQSTDKHLIVLDLPEYKVLPSLSHTTTAPPVTNTPIKSTTTKPTIDNIPKPTTTKSTVKSTEPKISKPTITTVKKTTTTITHTTARKADTIPLSSKVVERNVDSGYYRSRTLTKPQAPRPMSSVEIKEIPIFEYRNRPKYLIPVDSITRIKAQFYYLRARQMLEKGNYLEGEKCLRKSLEINQNNAPAWSLHADLYLANKAPDKAIKEYKISSEIDSTNAKIFYNMAMIYHDIHQDQRAYKYFSKALEVNDKYTLAYMSRATMLMDQRDYVGAVEDYDKIIVINRYSSAAYQARGIAYMELKRFVEAVGDFDKYLEIEEPDGYVTYQRGIAKILSNNLLQGCLDLAAAMDLGYKDAERAIKRYCE